MKKFLKIFATMLMLSAFCFSAVGCQKESTPSFPRGWYDDLKFYNDDIEDTNILVGNNLQDYKIIEDYYYKNPRNCGMFIFEYDDSLSELWLDGREIKEYQYHNAKYAESYRGTAGYYIEEYFGRERWETSGYYMCYFMHIRIVPMVQEYSGQELKLEFSKNILGYGIRLVNIYAGEELFATFAIDIIDNLNKMPDEWLGEYILKNLKWVNAYEN